MARKPDPKRAVAYLRCSTEKQDLSPDAQRAAIAAWAAAEGITLVSERLDFGVSGGAPIDECEGLLAAIDDLTAHGAGLLVVARRDRLARDALKANLVEFAAERQAKAKVVSAAGEGNGDTPSDALTRGLLDLLSAYFRADIKMKTKAALRVKKARGELTGDAPLGYTSTEGVRSSDGKRYVVPPKLIPDEGEQRAIARMRELRAAGLSTQAIADRLTQEGPAPRSGGRWHRTQVVRILGRST